MKKKQQKRAADSRKAEGSDELADLIAPMRGLVEEQKKIFVERHEYRDAKAADFRGRDRKWYDAAERELVALGYRPLGDIVDETVARMGIRVVIRRLVSEDGTNAAAVYQFVQGSGFMKIDLRVCDVESELSDGSFLTTSNAEASAAASLPKQIRSTKYPADTTIADLVARHDDAKRKVLKSKRGTKLRATEIRTSADYMAMQHRQEVIKAAFRQGIGYLDPEEVRRIAEQDAPDEPIAAGVAAAVAGIARQQAQLEKDNPAAAKLIGMLLGGKGKGKGTGIENVASLVAQLQEAEPKEQQEARQSNFHKKMAKAKAEAERRRAAHVKKRLAKGLSEKAGTGTPEPEILIHGLPVGDLDYKDKRGRSLDAMIKEIKASKARRDAKVLAKLPIGHSRVGGLPDLPPGKPWPTHKGKKIPFVAQLDLGDFSKAAHPLLPRRGYLYAFALISNDQKHWPPPVSVFLYEGDAKSLVRAPFPADEKIWPDWGGERVYEILPATAKPKGRDAKKRSGEFGETLGWLQGSMDDYFGTPGEIADRRLEDGDDWINLLAIESEGSMQWSDCGHLYFLIRRSALKKRDFSNVLAEVLSS